MGFRYRRNSFEALRSDSLFVAGYHGFRRTVTIYSLISLLLLSVSIFPPISFLLSLSVPSSFFFSPSCIYSLFIYSWFLFCFILFLSLPFFFPLFLFSVSYFFSGMSPFCFNFVFYSSLPIQPLPRNVDALTWRVLGTLSLSSYVWISVYRFFCVNRILATGRSPIQGILRNC
jgi:hypothetical protein